MTRSGIAAALAALSFGIGGCTTQSVMEPFALTNPQPASRASDILVQFDPVVGAPESAAGVLSQGLSARAAETGLNLVPAGGTGTLSMRGYFSAFSEDGATTVVYVWDVVDAAGNRVHRIQGQQQAPAGPGEGWASVSDPTMQAIAQQTIDQLVAWLATNTG
jgi:hypothetical protein